MVERVLLLGALNSIVVTCLLACLIATYLHGGSWWRLSPSFSHVTRLYKVGILIHSNRDFIYKADIMESRCGTNREDMMLIALMSGNDYVS